MGQEGGGQESREGWKRRKPLLRLPRKRPRRRSPPPRKKPRKKKLPQLRKRKPKLLPPPRRRLKPLLLKKLPPPRRLPLPRPLSEYVKMSMSSITKLKKSDSALIFKSPLIIN